MKAALIIIGTELTRGIIQDKHGPLVSKELTALGVHISEIIELPDDGSIKDIIGRAKDDNDILIITGGLGPTSDDMTRDVIATTAHVALVKNEDCWNHLLERLGPRAYGANEKQAYIPDGFSVINNNNGTAPGFFGYGDKTLMISLPGPPGEMNPMFYESVLPLIREKLNKKEEEREEFSSFITAEAKLEELCEEADPTLNWGTRFQDYKISLYVSGKSAEERAAAIAIIREKVGIKRLVDGDVEALDILIDTLKERNLTIGCAESCTGGLASSLLTSKSGASSYMLGSITSYAPSVKMNLLGVKKETVESFGVVSLQCAREMAEGVQKALCSDVAFSITGVAGPDKSEGKDVGTVCFGFADKTGRSASVEVHLNSWGRESVRRRSSVIAFLLTDSFIKGENLQEIVNSWRIF